MKFHPLALSAFFLASEANAFVAPNDAIRRPTARSMEEYNLDTGDVLSKREQVLREMEQVEARKKQLQAEAKLSMEEARALQARVAGGAIGGPAAPIAAVTLAAIAVGRDSLNKRQKKIDEEKARLDEERAKLDNQSKKNQNIFGVSSKNVGDWNWRVFKNVS